MVYGLFVLEDKEAPLSCSWPIATELKKLPLPKKKAAHAQSITQSEKETKQKGNELGPSSGPGPGPQLPTHHGTIGRSCALRPCCVKKTKAE